MPKIKEIIYVPTLRCNYRCTHCGQDRDCVETSCELVQEQLLKSEQFKYGKLLITGGEPFLKDDLVDFVLSIIKNGTTVSITTNGSCTDKIHQLVSGLNSDTKLSFAISIDGLESTHNFIRHSSLAYQKAIESVRIIHNAGLYVNINMVVQPSNIDEMETLQDELNRILGYTVPISFIPMISSISQDDGFKFSRKEASIIYPHLRKEIEKKYILAGEAIKIIHCHAGTVNAVISPDARVYTCLTGFSYLGQSQRESYLMGDLKSDDLDDIFFNKALNKETKDWQKAVYACAGCDNPCEWSREQDYFGAKIEFTDKDYVALNELLRNNEKEMCYWFQGWHPAEIYNWGTMHWMSDYQARLLYKIKVETQKLNIYYCNSRPTNADENPMALSLIIEGTEVIQNLILDSQGILEVLLHKKYNINDVLNIELRVSNLWRPCDYEESDDCRNLGIAINYIQENIY